MSKVTNLFKFVQMKIKENSAEWLNIKNILGHIKNIKEKGLNKQAVKLLGSAPVIITNEDRTLSALNNISLSDKNLLEQLNKIIKDVKAGIDWLLKYKKLTQEFALTEQDARDKLLKIAMLILARSQELVPVDTGFLKSSGIVFEIPNTNKVVIAYVAPYALYQHENMEYKHKVGRAKFLEIAVQEFFPNNRVWVEHYDTDGVAVILTIEAVEYYKGDIE